MLPVMRCAGTMLVLLLGLTFAGAHSPERRAQRAAFRSPCSALVRETAGLGAPQKKAQQTCMDEQPELKALLEKLWQAESAAETEAGVEEPCVAPARGRGRQRTPNPLRGCGTTCALNLLQEGGFDEDLINMRRCLAREAGQLNEDGTFNQTRLDDKLLAAVAGKETESNTQIAVLHCPPVVNYDAALYFRCVRSYCIKGEPPVDSFANSFIPVDALRFGPGVTTSPVTEAPAETGVA